jgi:uncharacterized protein YkwD
MLRRLGRFVQQRPSVDRTRSTHAALALALTASLYASAAQDDRPADPPLAVLARVNHYRSLAGVPPLAMDTPVATAAQSHAQYMADTRQLNHGEPLRTSRHFTANSLEDRLRKAGVHFKRSGEVVGLASEAAPATIVDDLMASVYHRLLLLSGEFDRAGAGAARGEEGGVPVLYVAIDLAGGEPVQPDLSTDLIVYPGPDQREVPRDFDPATETPNALPEHELVGLPVSVQVAAAQRLVVNRFHLFLEGQTTPVEARVLTQSEDMQVPEWAAVLVPLQPLAPGTAYRAEFEGAIGGREVAQRWGFLSASTGSAMMSFAQAAVAAGGTQTIRLRNVEAAAGRYYVCYAPVELVRSSMQETFTRFTLQVNQCAGGAACTVTVVAAYDKDCRQPFARGSFQVGN